MPLDTNTNDDILELGLTHHLRNKETDDLINNKFNLKMKNWFLSRTIWVALLQGISSIMIAFLSQDPTLAGVGWFMTGKSFVDIFLRFVTTTEIK